MDNNDFEYQDMKVISQVDCGNSPKKKVLKEITLAFAKKDIGFINELITDDVSWNIVGDVTVQGRDKVFEVIINKITYRIVQIEILNIITHGNTGAVNGTLKLEDNSHYSFCNVCKFVSAGKNTIKEITSYVIKT